MIILTRSLAVRETIACSAADERINTIVRGGRCGIINQSLSTHEKIFKIESTTMLSQRAYSNKRAA